MLKEKDHADWINKMLSKVIIIVFVLIGLVGIMSLTGCSSTIKAVHTESFKTGCAVVNAQVRLGYMNQEGQAEACKLICSKELPDNFTYEYNNGMCKVKVGK